MSTEVESDAKQNRDDPGLATRAWRSILGGRVARWTDAGARVRAKALKLKTIPGRLRRRISRHLFGPPRPGRLTLICMVRDEAEIIRGFMAHALALFDHVIVFDHRSTDGTGEFLRELSARQRKVQCIGFDETGYYQSKVMTWAAHNLVRRRKAGWVFLLDADEYLPFASRGEFESALMEHAEHPVIRMNWLNLVPLDMESGAIQGGRFLRPPVPSPYVKIAYQPSKVRPKEFAIWEGNHSLVTTDAQRREIEAHPAFGLYHLPIRTKRQLQQKVENGAEAYRLMGVDRGEHYGTHWDQMKALIASQGITDDLMAYMIVRYAMPMEPPFGRSIESIRAEQYSEFVLDVAAADPGLEFPRSRLGDCPAPITVKAPPVQRPARSLQFDAKKKMLRFRDRLNV
ncbi:MAG: glycosyltransferase family 2 protein [Phycisphaeraceae bacterium]|nr:glycosyltransferase family 2 protein [Phycisphaeraceae bacterium]